MSATAAQVETCEALCSALYQMPFSEFLGEADAPDRDTEWAGWFHLGEKPKDIRVTVARPQAEEHVVLVHVEWYNYHADPRNPIKGVQTLRIYTYAATTAMLQQPTTAAVLKVLEVYRDVVAETGVAGDISALMPTADGDAEVTADETEGMPAEG